MLFQHFSMFHPVVGLEPPVSTLRVTFFLFRPRFSNEVYMNCWLQPSTERTWTCARHFSLRLGLGSSLGSNSSASNLMSDKTFGGLATSNACICI